VQELSVQERSVKERSVQERSVQERSVQERPAHHYAWRPATRFDCAVRLGAHNDLAKRSNGAAGFAVSVWRALD